MVAQSVADDERSRGFKHFCTQGRQKETELRGRGSVLGGGAITREEVLCTNINR